MKKTIGVFMILLMLASLCACTKNNNDAGAETLPAPEAVIYGDIVSWNKINNAVSYDVYVDGSLYQNVTDTFFTVPFDTGVYKIRIIAKGDGIGFMDSAKSNEVEFSKVDATESAVKYSVLEQGSYDYAGLIDDDIEFVSKYQLKRDFWWRALEGVFSQHMDNDGGYRAEFWGKLLRGGVDTYEYNQDEELYDILDETVRNVLEIQKSEPDGRLSGFDVELEFSGWDIRSRYYMLLGLEYFYRICKDPALKESIIDSLCAQADYIIKYIGPESEGKTEILTTSPDWGGCTSANVLDSIVRLYMLTGEEKYKTFARYIIDTGGSTMRSDSGKTIVESALAGDPMYTYGCRKFYEVCVFFEGVLDYYLATGDTYALRVAEGFYKSNAGIETTEIGSCAVDVEEACHSEVEQCNPSNLGRMNETCVATTWLRFCLELFQITGNPEMMDYIERLYYNFGFGIIDRELHNDWPIFSYSPLATMARADIYSGTAFLDKKGEYCQSCCVISGVSLLPTVVKASILEAENGYLFNIYIPGSVDVTTKNGNAARFVCETEYPKEGNIRYTVNIERPEKMSLSFRIPEWSKTAVVKVNGNAIDGVETGKYATIDRVWKYGDVIDIELDMRTYLIHGSEECSNPNGKYNVVVKRGPLVFARDSRLEGEGIFRPLIFAEDEEGYLDVEVVENPSFLSQCQLKVKLENGEYVTLVDYGSAGKTMDDNSVMCLWIPTVDYWSVDLTKDLVVRSDATGAPIKKGAGKETMVSADAYAFTTDKEILSNFAWKLELQSNGMYRIRMLAYNGYLTVRGDGRIMCSDEISDGAQLFTIRQCGMNRYKFVMADGRVLSLHDDGTIYVRDDINHPKQYWKFVEL
ncbi:MAG: glycoside hydrolase family 127 protein [Eubacteriales bacterium]|nr:glycoside hydrolase family 127 protein [Christensenellaceae bacterium]MDY2751738.1 glycoside hydrolase family 127 protein [Eubacteriales bacterium]